MAEVSDIRARDIARTFAGLTDDQIAVFLDDAAHRLGESPGRWGGCYDLAQVYLTMHLMSSSMYGATGGPMTAASAGGISVQFGSAGGASNANSTRWMALLQELAISCGLAGMIVIVGQPLCDETSWR